LRVYDVDEIGLDRLDRAVLTALVVSFGGGPVGLSTLAVAVGEQPDTVEEVCEPFLLRAGLLARTPRGRVATAGGWRHLGLGVPPAAAGMGLGGLAGTFGDGIVGAGRRAGSGRTGEPDMPDLFSLES
jgi:Holliday junction DNA helicase RuvB